jgi:hypothetical protein
VTLIPVEIPTATVTDVAWNETGSGPNEAGSDGPLASPSQQAPPTFATSIASSPSAAAPSSSSSQGQAASDTSSAVGSVFTGAASVLGRQRSHGQIAIGLLGLAALALI